MLGYCGRLLTIDGIPDGTIGAVVFILDNVPGSNTYSYEVKGGDTARIDVREEDMLAGWSNARRGPMPGLEMEMDVVTAHFEAGDEETLWTLITTGTAAAGTAYDRMFRHSRRDRTIDVIPKLGSLRRPLTLPSEEVTTVGRLLAAMAYHELASDTESAVRQRIDCRWSLQGGVIDHFQSEGALVDCHPWTVGPRPFIIPTWPRASGCFWN